jgi:hypothetical protein
MVLQELRKRVIRVYDNRSSEHTESVEIHGLSSDRTNLHVSYALTPPPPPRQLTTAPFSILVAFHIACTCWKFSAYCRFAETLHALTCETLTYTCPCVCAAPIFSAVWDWSATTDVITLQCCVGTHRHPRSPRR